MTPLKLSLITGSLAALLTLGGQHHVRQGRVQAADYLRRENDRLRFEASRQHQAGVAGREAGRTKVDPAPLSPAKPEEARAAENPGDQSVVGSRVPGAEYRNEGQATPVAAMQSLAWACDQGDAVLMENLLTFDEAARPKAQGYLATLPEPVRAQWATPEAMAAALMISDGINRPYPVATIIQYAKTEQLRPGRMVVLLPGTGRERIEYQETPAGWKYAISEAMVDDYIMRATAQAQTGR